MQATEWKGRVYDAKVSLCNFLRLIVTPISFYQVRHKTFQLKLNMSLQLLPSISQPYGLLAPRNVAVRSHSTPVPTKTLRFHSSTRPSQPSPAPPTPPPNTLTPNPTLPSINIFREVRNTHPAVRYTIYAGLGLMATVESTFWFNVIKANFFPAKSEEEQLRAQELMENLHEAVVGARAAWMGNYGRYYGGYVWGVGER
jgi:hypothetical protein